MIWKLQTLQRKRQPQPWSTLRWHFSLSLWKNSRRLSRPAKINTLQEILCHDYWLTSDGIDQASYLMAKDHDHLDGFQSVLPFSAIAQGGIVGTPEKKFVQMLNIRQSHWITVSNVFCNDTQFAVYDSLRSPLDPRTLQALSWLLRPQSDTVWSFVTSSAAANTFE